MSDSTLCAIGYFCSWWVRVEPNVLRLRSFLVPTKLRTGGCRTAVAHES